jgi:hypothetical protein
MRSPIAFLLAFALAVAMAATVFILRKNTSAQAEVAAAKAQAEAAHRQLNQEKAQRQEMEQQRDQLIKVADEVGAELRKKVTSEAPPGSPEPAAAAETRQPALGKLVSQMMADPETRKFIREQQRMTIEQLYNPLIKKLALSAEEGAEFKQLLLDRALQSSEKALGLMGGQQGEGRTQALNELAEDQRKFEEDIRTFLGESRYTEYKDYQETVGERTQLNMFRQADAAGQTMNDEQTDSLLAIMSQEKRALQETTGAIFPGANQDPSAMESLLKEDQSARAIEAQETLNQRVYERAGEILSNQQLEAFARFQTNQLQMMRLGLKMARQMLGP